MVVRFGVKIFVLEQIANPSFLDLANKCMFLSSFATADRVVEVFSYLSDSKHVILEKVLDEVTIGPKGSFPGEE